MAPPGHLFPGGSVHRVERGELGHVAFLGLARATKAPGHKQLNTSLCRVSDQFARALQMHTMHFEF